MNISKNNSFSLTNAVKHLAVHDNVSFLFKTDKEQSSVIVPYIRNGLKLGEKCIYFTGNTAFSTVADLLAAGGIDVEAARTSGAFVITARAPAIFSCVSFTL